MIVHNAVLHTGVLLIEGRGGAEGMWCLVVGDAAARYAVVLQMWIMAIYYVRKCTAYILPCLQYTL